ncbi:LysR family transcriptional regulator [Burkholderia sp. Ac-20353]|nr:LysR family transcriptional regulator [Burkholderia sp. Ac-20353]
MDVDTLDLNLLRIFDALMRTRNVTSAGEAVGLSQPAVSYALAKLRTAHGRRVICTQQRRNGTDTAGDSHGRAGSTSA